MLVKANKDDIKKFDESDIGKIKNKYLKRSTIIGVILIIFSICYLILDIYNNAEIFDYIITVTVFLFGIYFIINSRIIKYKEVNKYIHDQKNKTSKK